MVFRRVVGLLLCGLVLGGGMASAEMRMSLTIEGDLDEILAILRHLKTGGFGKQAGKADNPLKVFVHSLHKGEATEAPLRAEVLPEESAAAQEEAAAVVAAALRALKNPMVDPPMSAPGAAVVIMIEAVDEENRIDTISAHLPRLEMVVDLYDNGTHGDAAAGDGIWSAALILPEGAAKGEYAVVFSAYDAAGQPLQDKEGEGEAVLLTEETALVVTE